MVFNRGGFSIPNITVTKKILTLNLVADPHQFFRFKTFFKIYGSNASLRSLTKMANDPMVCRSFALLMQSLPQEGLLVDEQFVVRDHNQEIKMKFPHIDSLYSVRQCEKFPADFPKDFNLNNVDKVINDIINIIRNPLLVVELLKPLNARVSQELQKNGVEFSELNDPAYFIPGCGSILPGPPKGGFECLKKLDNLLDRVLLEYENHAQVNLRGSPLFHSFIENEKANDLVSEGNIFREYSQYGQMILHGAYTHRLMLQVLWAAMDRKLIDISYTDKNTGQKMFLTKRQLLQLLVCFETRYTVDPNNPDDPNISLDFNPWVTLFEQLIDLRLDDETNFDLGGEFDRRAAVERIYPFVLRNAAIFNGFITCFGKDLGVAALAQVLCNMTWKQYLKMVEAAYDTGCIQQGVSKEDVYSQLVLMRIYLSGSEQNHNPLPFAKGKEIDEMLSTKHMTFYPLDQQPKKPRGVLLKKPNSVLAAEKSVHSKEKNIPTITIINKDSLRNQNELRDFFDVIENAAEGDNVDKLKKIVFFMNMALVAEGQEGSQGVIREDNINQLAIVTSSDASQAKYLKIDFSTNSDLDYSDHLSCIFFPLMKLAPAQQENTHNENNLKNFSFYIPLEGQAYLYMREIIEIDPLFFNRPWGLDFSKIFSPDATSRYYPTIYLPFRRS